MNLSVNFFTLPNSSHMQQMGPRVMQVEPQPVNFITVTQIDDCMLV